MNRLFRFFHIFVLCCVALFLFGVHTNVGECGLRIPTVEVTAYWEPAVDSWLKLPRNAALSSRNLDPFVLKPAHASQEHPVSAFNVFLPPRTDKNLVRDVWAFDVRRMLPFLRQFHPGATIALSGQQGAYACLRAVSPDYYEIVFQFHADFNLEITREMEEFMVDEVDEAIVGLKKIVEDEVIEELKKAIAEEEEIEHLEAEIESLKSLNVELDTADDLANLKKELAETVASLTKVTTSLEGLSGDLETRLNELKTTIAALENLVSNLESRLDELEKRLTAHFDAKLNELEKTLAKNLDAQLDEFQKELSTTLGTEFNTLQKMLTAREYTLTERFNALLIEEMAKLKGTQAYNESIYLKPKQFTGHLLISKDGKEIIAFTLKCPPHEGNATLFVFGDTETVSIPRMELIYPDNIEAKKINITWTDTITAEQADEALRSKFAARMSQTR